MFVVTHYDYNKNNTRFHGIVAELSSIKGIVYNESDFNRYLDEAFPGVRERNKRKENMFGALSLSYELTGDYGHGHIVMEKVEEIGVPI
jgi:hypothetical protein